MAYLKHEVCLTPPVPEPPVSHRLLLPAVTVGPVGHGCLPRDYHLILNNENKRFIYAQMQRWHMFYDDFS